MKKYSNEYGMTFLPVIPLPLNIVNMINLVSCNHSQTTTLASPPGHTQLFQHIHEKSGRAWYQKSCVIRHRTKGEN